MRDIRKKVVDILGQMYADGVMEFHPNTANNADRILALLPRWIPVEERLPELFKEFGHSAPVLVTNGRTKWVDTYWKDGNWSESPDWSPEDLPTHWLDNCPQLPKEKP